MPKLTNWFGSGSLQQGDLLFYQDGDWIRLPLGTVGQVLTSQGALSPPIWDDLIISSSLDLRSYPTISQMNEYPGKQKPTMDVNTTQPLQIVPLTMSPGLLPGGGPVNNPGEDTGILSGTGKRVTYNPTDIYTKQTPVMDVNTTQPLQIVPLSMSPGLLPGGGPGGDTGILSGTGKRVEYNPTDIYTKQKPIMTLNDPGSPLAA